MSIVLTFPHDRSVACMNPADHEWGRLMAAAQGGHGGAYRRLLEDVRKWLQRFYARRLPMAYVDDAVQETLVALHEKRHTYNPERPFKPWLIAIAHHKWVDRLRSMARHSADTLPDDIPVKDHESQVISASVLGSLLDMLRPAQAEVIRLVKLDGLSIEEASDRTGQSQSLVKVNIHRGLARLATMVQDVPDDA